MVRVRKAWLAALLAAGTLALAARAEAAYDGRRERSALSEWVGALFFAGPRASSTLAIQKREVRAAPGTTDRRGRPSKPRR